MSAAPQCDAAAARDPMEWAQQVALEAATCFDQALSTPSRIDLVSRGLNLLCRAALHCGDLSRVAVADRGQDALRRLAPIVCAEVGDLVPEGRVYFGLGAAAALLAVPPDALHLDRISYATILGAELTIIAHRREIERRGDAMARAIVANRVWAAADAAPGQLH